MGERNTVRLEQLRALLKEEPRDPFLHYAMALELKALDDRPAAIARFKELLSIDPGNVPGHYQLAVALSEAAQPGEAVMIAREGLRLATEQRDAKAMGELRELLQGLDEDE